MKNDLKYRSDLPTMMLVRPENRLLADRLICEENQWNALDCPILRLQKLPDAMADLTAKIMWAKVVFWVSPSAVEIAEIDLSQNNLLDLNLIHVAVGKSTAQALKKSGANTILCSESGNDSEAVLRLPIWQEIPISKRKLLIIRGKNGRDLLANHLKEWGWQIECAEIYVREKQEIDWQSILEIQPQAVWITSSEMVDLLFQQVQEVLPSFTQNLKSLIYFTLHERITQTLLRHEVREVYTVQRLQDAFELLKKRR